MYTIQRVYIKIIVISITLLTVTALDLTVSQREENFPYVCPQPVPIRFSPDISKYPQLKFSIGLLDALQKENPNENVLFSPHGVYQLLLMTYFGAAGETETELKIALGLTESKDDTMNAYKLGKNPQVNRIQNQTYEFTSQTRLFFPKNMNIR